MWHDHASSWAWACLFGPNIINDSNIINPYLIDQNLIYQFWTTNSTRAKMWAYHSLSFNHAASLHHLLRSFKAKLNNDRVYASTCISTKVIVILIFCWVQYL